METMTTTIFHNSYEFYQAMIAHSLHHSRAVPSNSNNASTRLQVGVE